MNSSKIRWIETDISNIPDPTFSEDYHIHIRSENLKNTTFSQILKDKGWGFSDLQNLQNPPRDFLKHVILSEASRRLFRNEARWCSSNCDSCNYCGTCGFCTNNDLFYILKYNGSISSNEPRNNDGRTTCYWCGMRTEKRGMGLYDLCPKCQR